MDRLRQAGGMDETARRRATALLGEHAPEFAGVPVRDLGQGLENTAFVAGELVLRVAGDGGVMREARLLELPAPRLWLFRRP